MKMCGRARELFGSYWDDETTRAEREWLESHFATCPQCRSSYEALARTLGAVAELPRAEAPADFADRVLAATRRASPARDVIFVRETPTWIPLTAAAAVALLAVATLAPMLTRPVPGPSGGGVSFRAPHTSPARAVEPPARPASQGRVAAISDSLFDHSEDIDFVLDPVTLRRGRANTVSRYAGDSSDKSAVITF